MGVESYLLRLRTGGASRDRVAAFLRHSFGAAPDPGQSPLTPAYSHFVYRDGAHVIEYELFETGVEVELSLRFALCNRPSIDTIVIEQCAAVLKAFDAVATICEELPAGEPQCYTADDLDQFAANYVLSASQARDYWSQMFGPERLPLPVGDALRKFLFGEGVVSTLAVGRVDSR